MSEQIKFFTKNFLDITNPNVTITTNDTVGDAGQDFVNFMRDRKSTTAWMTTNSDDTAITTIECDWKDYEEINEILILGHNFKNFSIDYYNGITWINHVIIFNNINSCYHGVLNVYAYKIRITVTATIKPNEDKVIKQLICTTLLGQFEGWPTIKAPTHSTDKKQIKLLSGKIFMIESLGNFSCELTVPHWKIAEDIALIEKIYMARQGVLMWLTGGDENQFFFNSKGYRNEDIYFVRPTNDFTPEYVKGIYTSGMNLRIRFVEVVE